MKKPCASCGKPIPQAAQHCVFCNAKQPALEIGDPQAAPSDGFALADSAPRTASSKAGVTLMGLRVDEVQAAMRAQAAADEGGLATNSALDPTPVRGLPVVPATPDPTALPRAPFAAFLRLMMATGGLVLIALFSLPWRGVSSWQLLETLSGADFVRQLYFLAGGAVLVATAVLPVPIAFRALVGGVVATLPLVLGAEGLLDGWRGLVAALAVISLPATHLVRTRRGGALDGLARTLVLFAAAFVAILYLVPVSSVVPIVYVGRMLASMSVGHTVVGLFIAIPLVLAALSLLGALGRDLADVAVLLSVLILLWAPAAVLIFVDDGTQVYVALALLWTSAIATLCLAQLLTLAAARAPRQT